LLFPAELCASVYLGMTGIRFYTGKFEDRYP